MNCPDIVLAHPANAGRAVRLSCTGAFYLLASITVSFLAGSSAPTPLYPLYQAEWGYSPVTTTLVFGVYALAVLGALLVAGRLSDHVGRRPVLIAATAAQVVTMLIFATAKGVPGLVAARVVQGLSTGAAVAAVGAGLLDFDKGRGTTANAIAPTIGTASGGVLAGLTVQYLPAPTHLVYLLLVGIFVLQGIAIAYMPESSGQRPGALASLKPQLTVPRAVRAPLVFAVPALVATWSLVGFYGALGPSLIREISQVDSALLGGLALFVLAGSAGASVLSLQRHDADTTLRFGALALFAGMGIVLAAMSRESLGLFFLGTSIAGSGFGAAFQGAVRTVMPLAAAHEKAGVLSAIFITCYLAMGVPAVIAGYLIVHYASLHTVAHEFGVVVMVLAALTLMGALRSE